MMAAGKGARRASGTCQGEYPEGMGKTILAILGVILAIWLILMVIGWIFAMLKTFFIIGLIGVVLFIVVSLVARTRRRA